MNRMSLSALLSTLALGFAAPALAEIETIETATIKVYDLNLSSDAGQATLETRIRSAARRVCGDGTISGTRIPNYAQRDACIASIRRQVSEQVAAREALVKARG